jgi:metal-responsive CopG/Arc/MetJ family transcriptional regulator
MDTIRLNVILPKKLAQELEAVTAPKKRSQFIADAIKRRIKEMRDEQLRGIMEEGYRANAGESKALAREFEAADLEGWDDY